MKTIEMKALRVKTIFESVGEKVESGKITIREAAIIPVSYTHLTLPTKA